MTTRLSRVPQWPPMAREPDQRYATEEDVMSEIRVKRMVKELRADPVVQFYASSLAHGYADQASVNPDQVPARAVNPWPGTTAVLPKR